MFFLWNIFFFFFSFFFNILKVFWLGVVLWFFLCFLGFFLVFFFIFFYFLWFFLFFYFIFFSDFLMFFFLFILLLSKLLRLLLNASKVTTGHQKLPKIGQNSIISSLFARRAKKASAEGWCPPQELDVVFSSCPYIPFPLGLFEIFQLLRVFFTFVKATKVTTKH